MGTTNNHGTHGSKNNRDMFLEENHVQSLNNDLGMVLGEDHVVGKSSDLHETNRGPCHAWYQIMTLYRCILKNNLSLY